MTASATLQLHGVLVAAGATLYSLYIPSSACTAVNACRSNTLWGYQSNLCPTSKRCIVPFVAGESGDRITLLTPHSPSKY
eukprot:311007-Pleurochrysis_carterae.AAC.3